MSLAQYILELKNGQQQYSQAVEPQRKKRKFDEVYGGNENWPVGSFTTYPDISFSIPQRKKLKLDLRDQIRGGIRVRNANDDVETLILYERIEDIVCLPVPEKAQAQHNFCVFASTHTSQDLFSPPEHILWTLPAASTAPTKAGLIEALNRGLQPYDMRVEEPNKEEFSSQLSQAVRKGETAYHVRAFRGAKEGYLFFLPTGIFWGFKKPLEFFPFRVIEAVSYTSILQRTFNLVVSIKLFSDAEVKDFEFSMIDQADFAGIDAYVKRHGLQDASMAEQRRAKKVNVNGAKKGAAEAEEEDGEGELQKAHREIEQKADDDDDEEDDENFDPGSEGESEGEGSSSGGDDQAGGQDGDDGEDDEAMGDDEL